MENLEEKLKRIDGLNTKVLITDEERKQMRKNIFKNVIRGAATIRALDTPSPTSLVPPQETSPLSSILSRASL